MENPSKPRLILQQRLWKAGIALALFVGTLVIGNVVLLSQSSARVVGLDFIAFYTAGAFVNDDRIHELYDLPAVATYQTQLAAGEGTDLEGGFGPWWNPPFYALVFAPLAKLSFASALHTWLAINIGCVVASVVLLCRMFPRGAGWRAWGLVPLFTFISMPFLLTVTHGQNSGTSLLLLTLVVTAWRSNRPLLAGLVCGLLFYKPQLALIVAGVLVFSTGPLALAGVSMTLIALACVTIATMPGAISDYIQRLPENLNAMMVGHTYMWERHVTLRSFWRLLLQGREPGEASLLTHTLTVLTCATTAVALGVCGIRFRVRDVYRNSSVHRDRLIAASIVAMPLLMPFYFDYDLLLLVVPVSLLAIELTSRSTEAYRASEALASDGALTITRTHWTLTERRAMRVIIALYAWLMIANHVTPHTHLNITVPLLAVFAWLFVRRAIRSVDDESAGIQTIQPAPSMAIA